MDAAMDAFFAYHLKRRRPQQSTNAKTALDWPFFGRQSVKNFKVFSLRMTNCSSPPGTLLEMRSSLDSHIDLFLKLYASYKSLVGSSSTKMELSKEMAAAFFLQSLDRDQDLRTLVQNLYDVQPFDVTTITKRVALEQSRRDNVATEALFTNNRTQSNQGSSKKPSSNNTSNPPPTQGKGDNKKRQHHKKKRRERTGNHTESVSKRLEKLEKLLLNNSLTTSANAVTTRPSLDQSPEKEHCSCQQSCIAIECHQCKEEYQNLWESCQNNPPRNDELIWVTHSPSVLCTKGTCKSHICITKPISGKLGRWNRRKRLAHPDGTPNDKYLETLLTKLSISKPFTSAKDCEVCSKAKIQRTPHKSSLPQTSSPFFKIHSDTLEISPTTHKGYRYVLVLIDDYTRFNRIYLLNSKDQSESMIISYFTEIKNKVNVTPAYFHSDRGGEFTSTRLKRYFLQSGTTIEQGAPNSPQTNGVAERFNKTLLSKIRCLLCQSNIPITYWDEAARHASLLLNHTPHRLSF
ncbi:hypothetical protein O181_096286 [Austropuccinia psidii MF-1]|uniref:Integrase catalytic domain-containing protein n=1 Tax=Austropuccinia psidii MF-1 TaxID=1389203 RepID=A0A9Q3J6S2_9BASI|nr:hypothetical protein [Austropuccinia psidii MF-1]